MSSFVCHLCGAALDVSEPISRDAECPECRADVRCCRNCRHYDERYNNSCTETQADPVPEKTRRNFCEFFYFSREPFAGSGPSARRAADARSKLDALFGGKGAGAGPSSAGPGAPPGGRGAASPSDEAKRRLEGLFKKKPDA